MILDFGGTIGNAGLMVFLPLVTAYFFFAGASTAEPRSQDPMRTGMDSSRPWFLRGKRPYVGWFLFQAALQQWAPEHRRPASAIGRTPADVSDEWPRLVRGAHVGGRPSWCFRCGSGSTSSGRSYQLEWSSASALPA